MKFLIYCRKSTDSEDRQVLSLESQENELRRLAESQGLEVVGVLHESMSAKAAGRPIFNQVLRSIAKGDADAILCWKLDRLARNMVDGGQIIDLLQRGKIQQIRTYESVHTPSENTLLLSVIFGMANQYIRDLSVNVKRGMRAKLDRGEWPNHAPLGYLNDKATQTIVVDKARKRYIVKAFELYASGRYSFSTLADYLYEEGFRTRTGHKVVKSNLQYLLGKVFYTGVMERDGKFYQGKHPALISKSLYDAAQTVMHGNAHPKSKRLFFPLRGLVTCEICGCMFTASLKKGHQYYYCTNGKKICTAHKSYIRGEELNKAVAELLGSVSFSERKIDLMYRAAQQMMGGQLDYKKEMRNQISAQLQTLNERESRLLDAILDDKVAKEHLQRKGDEIHKERVSLERQLASLDEVNPSSTLERTKELFLEANKAKNAFLSADDERKEEIAKKLLWNFSIRDKSVAQALYKSPFDIMAKVPKNADLSVMLPG